jgi:hypothetical protein
MMGDRPSSPSIRRTAERFAKDFDVHAVSSPDRGWVDAVRLTREAHIPIYAKLYELAGPPIMLVEGAPRPMECKDLEGARTPAELNNELKSTFGSGGKTRSAADKQVERTAWLSARIPQALEHLAVPDDPSGWKVVSAIVTDVPVLAPYVQGCALPVYALPDLDELFSRGV